MAAPATWTFVLGGLVVVAAATLAGALAAGPTARQVLVALGVAALSALGCAVPLWGAWRELRHVRTLEEAASRFDTVAAEGSPQAALQAAVDVLLTDVRVVALHLGQRPTGLRGLARVVVDDALATGLPAEVPDGTTGRETARLLALPFALTGGRGAALLRVQRAADADVAAVRRLLARLTPSLTAAAPTGSDPDAAARPPARAAEPGAGDAALRELVARGAHDLRTPLNTLTGMVDTLVRHGDELSPSQHEQLLGALQRSTRRVAGWITALLDAAVDKRTGPALVEPCRLQPLLEEAVTVSKSATAGLDVYVAPTDLLVAADPGRVVRVVGNLLANAGHHAGNGLTVEVDACPRGEEVEVSVRDHGDGWGRATSAAEQDRDGGSHHDGLGLGLDSVRSQVASWGGELEFDDTPGGGATVRFTLPRAFAEEQRGAGRDPGWTIAGGDSHIRGARRTPPGSSTGAAHGEGSRRRHG